MASNGCLHLNEREKVAGRTGFHVEEIIKSRKLLPNVLCSWPNILLSSGSSATSSERIIICQETLSSLQ